MSEQRKPLGGKNYGSIGHLPSSRVGPGDWHVHEGQARIATEKARDRHDTVNVTEKLDGSNVGVAKIDGQLVALTRSGLPAATSRFPQHHHFANWLNVFGEPFDRLLDDGERVVGEWLLQAHGARYAVASPFDLFVAFDLMRGKKRAPYLEFTGRVADADIRQAALVYVGGPVSVADVMETLGASGRHGAIDPVEGAVWRVERKGQFDFMTKFVRLDKRDGCYLPELSGGETVWNYDPATLLESRAA